MDNIKKDLFFLNCITSLKQSTNKYSEYEVLPEYGYGKVIIYKVIQNLYLAYNNFVLNQKIINDVPEYKQFSDNFLEIDYCIKGNLLSINHESKAFLATAGISMYFEGIGNVRTFDPYDKEYESITLLGYSRKMIKSFEQIFQIDKNRFVNFFALINAGEPVVIKYNIIIKNIINDIKLAMQNGDNDIIKLKAMELLLYETKNFEKNKRVKAIYYNRSTIDKVMRIEKYVTENLDKKFTIDDLCNTFKISSSTLKSCFKQMFLTGIYSYIKQARMAKARDLLKNSEMSITQIALLCGYSNHSNFTKAFKKNYNIVPKDIREL